MMRVAGRTIWGCEPEEISLLHALFYLRAAGGLDVLLDVEGGAQQWRVEGGSQRLATTIAERLGPALRLGTPVDGDRDDCGRRPRRGRWGRRSSAERRRRGARATARADRLLPRAARSGGRSGRIWPRSGA